MRDGMISFEDNLPACKLSTISNIEIVEITFLSLRQ